MLTLIRKSGQCLVITPSASNDQVTTIKELFKDGPITIEFGSHRGGRRTKQTIQAREDLEILRFDGPSSTLDAELPDEQQKQKLEDQASAANRLNPLFFTADPKNGG